MIGDIAAEASVARASEAPILVRTARFGAACKWCSSLIVPPALGPLNWRPLIRSGGVVGASECARCLTDVSGTWPDRI